MSRRGRIPIVRILPNPDCAYCRRAELGPSLRSYRCKMALPMDARECLEFKDSRTPSSNAPSVDFFR